MLHAIPINSPDITSVIPIARLSLYALEQVAGDVSERNSFALPPASASGLAHISLASPQSFIPHHAARQ